MKTIIAGSRGITDMSLLIAAIGEFGALITEVVSGCAPNTPDILGERWAAKRGIPVRRFPANWSEHGRAAGPLRNNQMATYADALIALWDGKSRGTAHMIEQAEKLGLLVKIQRP